MLGSSYFIWIKNWEDKRHKMIVSCKCWPGHQSIRFKRVNLCNFFVGIRIWLGIESGTFGPFAINTSPLYQVQYAILSKFHLYNYIQHHTKCPNGIFTNYSSNKRTISQENKLWVRTTEKEWDMNKSRQLLERKSTREKKIWQESFENNS